MKKEKESNPYESLPSGGNKFKSASIYYGGTPVSTIKNKNGNMVVKYKPTTYQKATKNYGEKQSYNLLKSLGGTAPELAAQYDSMVNDYVGGQTDAFNKEYQKSYRGLQEDMTSRFGTLNATPFYDKLLQMEQDVKAPAYIDINRQGNLMRTELGNQDMQRKLTELGALGAATGTDYANFLNSVNPALSSAQLGANIGQNNYAQMLQLANSQAQASQNKTNSFLSFLGGIL